LHVVCDRQSPSPQKKLSSFGKVDPQGEGDANNEKKIIKGRMQEEEITQVIGHWFIQPSPL
jgi:hypothetical protein